MLIESPKLTARDRSHWRMMEMIDRRLGSSSRLEEMAQRSMREIVSFVRRVDGRCYAGVSWGKDSVVLAHLVARVAEDTGLRMPLVWIRSRPTQAPYCDQVRDAFLERWGHLVNYGQAVVNCRRNLEWRRGWDDTIDDGYAWAARHFGNAHISGIRAKESRVRLIRMRRHGHQTIRTCAPIGWWGGEDVFGYLAHHGLPVHPTYAASYDGTLDRIRLRVTSLGFEGGDRWGGLQWEQRYYADELRYMRGLDELPPYEPESYDICLAVP